MRNELTSSDGTVFNIRNVKSPIIVFTSTKDNISPPPQSLGWVCDIYRDVEKIRNSGQRIIYCLSPTIGHLAIFVSAKVGAVQDLAFIELMNVTDALAPGLYELVMEALTTDVPPNSFVKGDKMARFETRSLDNIKALGRNTPADDDACGADLGDERRCVSYHAATFWKGLCQPGGRRHGAGTKLAAAKLHAI